MVWTVHNDFMEGKHYYQDGGVYCTDGYFSRQCKFGDTAKENHMWGEYTLALPSPYKDSYVMHRIDYEALKFHIYDVRDRERFAKKIHSILQQCHIRCMIAVCKYDMTSVIRSDGLYGEPGEDLDSFVYADYDGNIMDHDWIGDFYDGHTPNVAVL